MLSDISAQFQFAVFSEPSGFDPYSSVGILPLRFAGGTRGTGKGPDSRYQHRPQTHYRYGGWRTNPGRKQQCSRRAYSSGGATEFAPSAPDPSPQSFFAVRRSPGA